ncbi:MAG: UbiA-like protein EboC [Arcicella sp.]|nr:UbiA-like protein EboC [Arcicella sp.]
MRPANLITAFADILAGMAIAGFHFTTDNFLWGNAILLSISTTGLYGGGVVFNDVFDAELDAIERPERAIPSGRVSKQNATILGISLLFIGILTAFMVSLMSGVLAIIISILALFYDRFGKHNNLFGPINMGLCRGVNLLLGISIINESVGEWWWVGIVPLIYISAITMISRGEVHGGKKNHLYFAGFLYILVSIFQGYVAFSLGNIKLTILFILLHIFLIFKPLIQAIISPIGQNIGKAVKAGVLSLIVMDAAWVAASGNWQVAICVLLLLPISMRIGKYFAVT